MTFNVNDILDATLDDLADLPAFEVPPAGAYHATILSMESKKINEHPSMEIKFRLNSTLELANSADTPVADGTETSIAYMLDNEFGQGKFKEVVAPIAEHLGVKSIREVAENVKGLEVMLVTSVRKSKTSDATYLDVKKVQIP